MPKTRSLPIDEIEFIKTFLKREITGAGSNIADAVRKVNEMYNSSETPQSVTRQINQGTIPFWKVIRIAKALNHVIILKE